MLKIFIVITTITIITLLLCNVSASEDAGKKLYIARCSMCHGLDAKATGYLAQKSDPPTPDLTSEGFQKRLAKYPGVIVAAIVLQPNGTLIPDTLKKNHVIVPPHVWTDAELRSINQYVLMLIAKQKQHIK